MQFHDEMDPKGQVTGFIHNLVIKQREIQRSNLDKKSTVY